MIDQLHDRVACMLPLSAYSGAFQIKVRVWDHRLSMHIANHSHWVLSALRMVLSEAQALHLYYNIRDLAEIALYYLTDVLCQASAAHRPPRGTFLVVHVHQLFIHFAKCCQRAAVRQQDRQRVSIYVLGMLRTLLGSASPFSSWILIGLFCASKRRESKTIWETTLVSKYYCSVTMLVPWPLALGDMQVPTIALYICTYIYSNPLLPNEFEVSSRLVVA